MVDTDDSRRMTDDERRTMPRVWHKLPTGELKSTKKIVYTRKAFCSDMHSVYFDIVA